MYNNTCPVSLPPTEFNGHEGNTASSVPQSSSSGNDPVSGGKALAATSSAQKSKDARNAFLKGNSLSRFSLDVLQQLYKEVLNDKQTIAQKKDILPILESAKVCSTLNRRSNVELSI